MSKIKVEQSRRRARRRRDDQDYLAVHQGQVDPALPGYRPQVLRPVHPEPRCHRRPDHRRRRERDQAVRRGCEMRHDHAGRGPGHRVRAQEDVALAQRHDPQHPRRRGLPRADRGLQHPAVRAGLDPAHHHRPPRPRRPVPGHRLRRARPGPGHDQLHPGRRRRPAAGPRGRAVRRRRGRHGHVQLRRLDRATSPGPPCGTRSTASTRCTCPPRTRS